MKPLGVPPCPRCGRRYLVDSDGHLVHGLGALGCEAFLVLRADQIEWVVETLARGLEAMGQPVHEKFLWWRGRREDLLATLKVPKEYQEIAESGQVVRDHGVEDTVKEWDVQYPDGYYVVLKLVNAKTDEGGPWCEAMWFKHDLEIGASEPTGSLVGRWEEPDGHVLVVELEDSKETKPKEPNESTD